MDPIRLIWKSYLLIFISFESQRNMVRELPNLLIHPVDACNSEGKARPKGCWDLSSVSYVVAGIQVLGHALGAY